MRPWPPVFSLTPPGPLPLPSSGRRWSFYLQILEWLLAREQSFCPFDPFWTPHWASQEELADSRLSQEYAVFRKAVLRDRFPTLLRIGRDCMPLIRPVIPSG